MSSAPIVTQMISFVLMPIIGRLYTPMAFGLYNVFGSITGPISALTTLGYHQAIVLPEEKDKAIILTYGSCLISLLISFITFVVILCLPEIVWVKYSLEAIKPFRWLLPISILFHGIHTTLTSLNQRNAKFGNISVSRVINALINKTLIIILAFLGYKSSGSLIIGSIIGALSMIVVLVLPNLKLFTNTVPFSSKPFIKYKKFPIFILSADFFYRLTDSVIIYLLVYFFSAEIVGYYGMAIMMASLPTILIGTGIAEVFYQKASMDFNADKKGNSSEKIFLYLVQLSIVPFAVLAITSPDLFSLFLGEKWLHAGKFTQILSFQMFINFIIIPITSLTKIYNKQEYALITQVLILLTSIFAIIIGSYTKNVYVAIIIMAVSSGIISFIFSLFMFYFSGVHPQKIIYIFFKYILFGVPFILPLILFQQYYLYKPIELFIVGGVCLLIYFITLFKNNSDFSLLIRKIIYKQWL